MPVQTELKPCPFCGGTDLSVRHHDIDGWIAHIQCDRCDGEVTGPDSEFKYDDKEDAEEDAANRWNTRATPAQPVEAQGEPVGNEPLFWYRPVGEDGGYEGPHHSGSELGKMLRAQMPGQWKPLYPAPAQTQPVEAQGEPVAWAVFHPDGELVWLDASEDNCHRFVRNRDSSLFYKHPMSVRPLYAAPQPAVAVGDKEQIERIYQAVLSCGHDIDAESIVLRYSHKAEGHNALNQLHRRITAALHGSEKGE